MIEAAVNVVTEATHINPEFTERRLRNFWRRVQKGGKDECWMWSSTVDQDGYGRFVYGSRLFSKETEWKTHRFAFAITNGPIPVGMMVCHKCDVPGCVNPSHLFLGTSQDNSIDRDKKGRASKGRSHRNATMRGFGGGGIKLSEEKVAQIREIYAAGGISQKRVASMFGTSQANISVIVTNKIWKPAPP